MAPTNDSHATVASLFEMSALRLEKQDKFRLQYLRKLSAEKIWVPQAQRRPEHQTLIIFDWDDTLLYSSFLKQSQGHKSQPDMQRHLDAIENAGRQLLELAVDLGRTFIVTNASQGWVEQTAARHLPSLLPILDRVSIVYARSTPNSDCEGELAQWKMRAFLEIGRQLDSEAITNLVSIGDSNFEREAARVLGSRFSQGLTKTVKFMQNPSPQCLSKELRGLLPEFPAIVEKASNVSVSFDKKR
jgi:hypothetical protein